MPADHSSVIRGESLPPDRHQGRRHTHICRGVPPQRPFALIEMNRQRHQTVCWKALGAIRGVRGQASALLPRSDRE